MSALEQTVPDGYKQTEVGVIPDDWESINFGDLFEQSISRKSIKASNPVTFIGMQDVSESAQLTNPQQRVFEQVKTGFTYFERNDVLVAKITPCFENGKGCYTDKITTRFGFGSTEFHVLRAKENSDAKFIYFWTTRNSLRQDLEGEMVGSAGHRRVPFSAIQNYLIPCPSSRIEQTAIANALSDVDALLTELEKLIAKKQAIKTATMQQLLTGKTRLPQFATYTEGEKQGLPKGTKSSEIGEIPEDWTCQLITEVVKRGAASIKIGPFGSALKKEYLVKNGYKVYGQENVYEKNMEIGDRYISHDHYVQLKSCKIEQGDFLISMMGTIGKCFIAPTDTKGGIMDSHLLRLRLDPKKLEARLLIQLFQTRIILDQISQLSVGGIMDGLSSKIIKSLYLPIPEDVTEQAAIATIFSNMDNEIQTLEQRLAKTRQIKQGMMQELLTGRTRLPFEKE